MSPTTTVSLEWWDIFKLVIGTGLITTIATAAVAWLRERSKENAQKERDAAYLAARVGVILEKFAIDCAEVISENDLFGSSGGHAGRPHVKLPSLQEFPADLDWKALEPPLTMRALSFKNEIAVSQRVIDSWFDIEPDCMPGACDEQAGKCGYRALLLAEEMRCRYKLSELNLKDISWDVPGVLKRLHDKAIKSVQEHNATAQAE